MSLTLILLYCYGIELVLLKISLKLSNQNLVTLAIPCAFSMLLEIEVFFSNYLKLISKKCRSLITFKAILSASICLHNNLLWRNSYLKCFLALTILS